VNNIMKNMYTIKDIKAGVYNTPWFATNTAEAIRSFHRAAGGQQTNISQFPEDFELFFIGIWDEELGKMNMLDKCEFVINAIQCQRHKKIGVIKDDENL